MRWAIQNGIPRAFPRAIGIYPHLAPLLSAPRGVLRHSAMSAYVVILERFRASCLLNLSP